jgi:AraC family transcriptional regulator
MTSHTVEQKKVTMRYQDLEAVPAPRYREDAPKFETLLSSEGRGWKNLQVYNYGLVPQPEPVAVPVIAAHTVQVLLKGSGITRGVVDGHFMQAPVYPGIIGIAPCETSACFDWTGTHVMSHIFLSPTLTKDVVPDLKRTDPDNVKLSCHTYICDPLIEQLCLALVHELESDGLHGSLYADTMALALTVHLLRHYSSLSRVNEIHARGLSKKQLQLVHEFIGDFLAADVGLDELANLTGLSAASFAKQFKISTGLPPHQYLIRRRIERAKELLGSKVLTVAEVSQAVGFFDQSHLIRHFKHWVGVTPKDYRESKNLS